MKKIIFSILVLFVSTLFFSCGDDNKEDDYDFPYYDSENYSNIEKELQKAELYCENSSNCPENVGLIFINIDNDDYYPRIGQCTGFLIAEDIVATNSHCLPDYLKSSIVQCDSKIAIRFMDSSDSSKNKNIFGCKEILDYSEIKTFSPDYVFFKIEKTGRKPFIIHKDGLKDNEIVSVAKINPLSFEKGGKLEIEECRVVLNSLLNFKSTSAWSRTGVILECDGIKGNSGSPILNNNGNVIGILQSKMLTQHFQIVKDAFKRFNLELPKNIKPHVLFTSFSCIDDPVNGLEKAPECLSAEKLHIVDAIGFENEKNSDNIQMLYNNWKEDLPSIFIYDLKMDATETGMHALAHPICVKPKDKFYQYDDYVKTYDINSIFSYRAINLEYPHGIVLKINLNVDEYYRLKSEFEFKEERTIYNIFLKRKNYHWTGTTNSTYISSSFDFGSNKIELTLPECSEQQLEAEGKNK